MIVAGVTLERYLAVYHPLDYNRRQQDSTSHGCRLVGEYNININIMKYLLCPGELHLPAAGSLLPVQHQQVLGERGCYLQTSEL